MTYPRPTNGSKRGAHWSASNYPAHANYQWHLDRMVEARIGWVKFLSDGNGRPGVGDSGLQFAIDVQARGMIGVARFYVPADHRWTDANSYAVEQYVRNGIVYIETINEPDLAYEWSSGSLPDDWARRSFENWCTHAARIIELGGIPLTPSLASGFMQARGEGAGQLTLNPFEIVREAGITRFVASIHNYALNHPIAYPDDRVNQDGLALTQAEYDRVGGGYAWDGQTLDQINAWRAADKNPGDTIWEDDSCFRACEIFRGLLDEATFWEVPVLTTEGGPCLTDRHDRRYPRVTPVVMWEMVQQQLAYMATRDWYLGYCWWLWGNNSVGGTGGWSTNQWFWPGGLFSDSEGFIPAVGELRALALGETPEEPEEPETPTEPGEPEGETYVDDTEVILTNDAEGYGVVVAGVQVEVGVAFWKVSRVHHLTGAENNGNHNVYVNVFRDGQPCREYPVSIAWPSGSGRILLEKPYPAEPMGNSPLWKGQVVSLAMQAAYPSEAVTGIHTGHADEEAGNTLYHHSFLVEFVLVTKTGGATQPEEPEPVEVTEDDIRNRAWNRLYPSGGVAYNPEAALAKEARARGLGAPVTNEFDIGQYRAQGFAWGILYCVVEGWGNVIELAW